MSPMRIYLVAYDSTWVDGFKIESAGLARLLGPWRRGSIEHIGSTAVPGLCAKPVIDLMVGVSSLTASLPAKQVLADAGYQYSAYRADVMHWFCKPSFAFRTHHIHLVPFESDLWLQRLAFRDALRTESGLAIEYAALKQELARTFEFDREAYTAAKAPFVARVLKLAGAD